MAMLDIVKQSLRISASNTNFDGEITELIDQALDDLKAAGLNSDVLAGYEDDGSLRRAVTLYSKAFFGLENPDKDWYLEHYEKKKTEMLNQRGRYIEGDLDV
jgi:hypothetical protein